MKSNLKDVSSAVLNVDADATLTPDIGVIGHVEVSLTAQVGTLTMTIERLFALRSGDIVTMNEMLEAPLLLMLNGKPVARGELVAIDDHFGVRILELA